MHTNIFNKHDAVDAADAADAAGAAGAVSAVSVVSAAGGDDCTETPLAPSHNSLVSIGGGPAGLAELQMLLPESGRSGGPFGPTQWDETGGRPVKSPQVSRQVRRRGYGRIVGKRRDSTPSGRVDDLGVKGQASSGGPGGEDSSDDGGSRSAGIGQRFAEPEPIGIPPKLYRIGEIVEHSGLSRQTIHNYTTMGLLIEARRTDGGHRLYDESVFERLNGIIALKAQHKSLAYIREFYAKSGAG